MNQAGQPGKPHSSDPFIGRQLGSYRVDRVLGRGGMATVYAGWDVNLHRPVALKVIDARYRDDPAYARRFVQEARAVAAWRHENIIQIYAAGEQDGLYYHAMEYIDGQDLAQLLSAYAADRELMPPPDVLRIGRAVASALDYAHTRGLIHRDVKPSNVLIARDGRVVLGDFGLALDVHMGSLGEAFGSPHYMAPEQARRSTDAVPQSDLYALGVMLYEMLTGAVPFDDPSPTTVALQHLTLPPTPPRLLNPRLNPATDAVLLKALSKAPEQRYATGSELLEALQRALAKGLEAVPGETPGSRRAISDLPVDARVAQTPPTSAPPARPSPAPQEPAGRAEPPAAGAWVPSPADTQPREPVARPAPASPGQRLVTPPPPAPGQGGWPVVAQPQRAGRARRPGWLLALIALLALAGVGSLWLAGRLGDGSPGGVGVEATLRYPNGRPLALFYNANSLYVLNMSKDVVPAEALAFERLDAEGAPVARFDGGRWAEEAPELQPGRCLRVVVLDTAPYLEPPECVLGYQSTRTPSAGDPAIFWTPAEGSAQFRVLWREEEIGRCDLAVGLCRVFGPP